MSNEGEEVSCPPSRYHVAPSEASKRPPDQNGIITIDDNTIEVRYWQILRLPLVRFGQQKRVQMTELARSTSKFFLAGFVFQPIVRFGISSVIDSSLTPQ